MAIKKQKRSPDAAGIARNGEPSKKVSKPTDKTEVNQKKQKKPFLPKTQKPNAVETTKPQSAKSDKLKEKILKKKENRKEARKEVGQYKPENINWTPEQIEKRIAEIKARDAISKTAKRKLAVLQKKLRLLNGEQQPKKESGAASKVKDSLNQDAQKKVQKKKATEETVAEKSQAAPVPKKKNAKAQQPAKPAVTVQKVKESMESVEEDDSEEDEEVEESDDENVSGEESEEAEDSAGEESDDDDDDDDEEEAEDDEDDDDDDDDDNEDAEVKYALPENKKKEEVTKKPAAKEQRVQKKDASKETTSNGDGKKKRFILFVANVPYTATVDDVKKHFLTKVSEVVCVRLPLAQNTGAPRGIAYVEFANETDYQKGLGLHNTTLDGRKLNVQYTQGGSKFAGKKSDTIAKNKKLHAMRNRGMFGGKRDDRNDRRKKQKPT